MEISKNKNLKQEEKWTKYHKYKQGEDVNIVWERFLAALRNIKKLIWTKMISNKTSYADCKKATLDSSEHQCNINAIPITTTIHSIKRKKSRTKKTIVERYELEIQDTPKYSYPICQTLQFKKDIKNVRRKEIDAYIVLTKCNYLDNSGNICKTCDKSLKKSTLAKFATPENNQTNTPLNHVKLLS